jgi:hypothetical protein
LAYDGHDSLIFEAILLLFKLITVPLFILIITLSGKRWGSEVAGTMGAFPVVAGPIVFFLTMDQGINFGSNAAVFAIYAVVSLMVFLVSYSWICIYLHFIPCLILSMLAWLISAYALTLLPINLTWALLLSTLSLFIAPRLFPKTQITHKVAQNLNDLPFRMLVGATLTYLITSLAGDLGQVWSGILSVFPVITLVLAVFTHRGLGFTHVIYIFRGVTKGLYSFVAYFFIYSLCLSIYGLWLTIPLAILGAILIQLFLQKLMYKTPKKSKP